MLRKGDAFFRKPTFNSLYDPFGSPRRGQKPSLPLKKVVLKSSRPSLPLKKAPPLISVFSPQGRRGKPPSGARNRFALWLADHQRSAPWLCGMGPPGGREFMALSKRILDSFHNFLCREAMVGFQQGFKLGYIFFFRKNFMVKKFVHHIDYS